MLLHAYETTTTSSYTAHKTQTKPNIVHVRTTRTNKRTELPKTAVFSERNGRYNSGCYEAYTFSGKYNSEGCNKLFNFIVIHGLFTVVVFMK